MKIIHVITRLILGGAQENTILTCREQALLGHDVTLLSGPPLGPEGSLLDAALAMSCRTVLVPSLRRAIRPWHDLEAYADLAKHFRDVHPDIVHTHSSKAGILGRLAARRAGVPGIVHTIHGLPFDAYQSMPVRLTYRALERRAARWSHRLIAVCEDMADRAAAAGLAPREAIDVVYSGMDTEAFTAAAGERDAVRAAWGAAPGDFVFVKVARLFQMKGHEFVLPAFAEVARRRPRSLLVLVGDGLLRPRFEADVQRMGLSGRVRFLGLVRPHRVPGLLWASDAVVHAGLREGLARVLPQAGFCRRPAITYNIGGAREVVRDGQNGYLLSPPALAPAGLRLGAHGEAAWRPLAEAMDRLVADPVGARRMGEQWPQAVLARFDYRTGAREILKVYEAAAG